jgi:uncharacterized BrkB/YihY/UPF0761 family membrane protein
VPDIGHAHGVFERSFIIDSFPVLVLVLVIVGILVALLLAYIFLLFRRYRPESLDAIVELPGIDEEVQIEAGLGYLPWVPLISYTWLYHSCLSDSRLYRHQYFQICSHKLLCS